MWRFDGLAGWVHSRIVSNLDWHERNEYKCLVSVSYIVLWYKQLKIHPHFRYPSVAKWILRKSEDRKKWNGNLPQKHFRESKKWWWNEIYLSNNDILCIFLLAVNNDTDNDGRWTAYSIIYYVKYTFAVNKKRIFKMVFPN